MDQEKPKISHTLEHHRIYGDQTEFLKIEAKNLNGWLHIITNMPYARFITDKNRFKIYTSL